MRPPALFASSRCLVRDLLEFECEGTFHIHDFGLWSSAPAAAHTWRGWRRRGLAGTVADLMASMYVLKYERRKCIKHEIAEMKCEHHLLYWLSAVQPI